jgi:hypothetical protein
MGPREEQKSSIQAVVTHNPYHPDGKNRAYPRLRFFGPKKELSDADLDRLVHIDYGRAMAFVAIEESSGKMVGVVRLHAEPNRDSREFAITVRGGRCSAFVFKLVIY